MYSICELEEYEKTLTYTLNPTVKKTLLDYSQQVGNVNSYNIYKNKQNLMLNDAIKIAQLSTSRSNEPSSIKNKPSLNNIPPRGMQQSHLQQPPTQQPPTQQPLTQQNVLQKFRVLINKLTDKNIDTYTAELLNILASYVEQTPLSETLCEDIIKIMTSSIFYVKNNAILFNNLAKHYPIFNQALLKQITEYLEAIKTMTYVDEKDYDLYCKMGTQIDKRKALSGFIYYIFYNTPDISVIANVVNSLLDMTRVNMNDASSKSLIDEIVGHLVIFITKDIVHTLKPVIKDNIELINVLASTKPAITKGITSKSLFSFQDLSATLSMGIE